VERWILLQNALSQKGRVTAHICVDVSYVVLVHEHLFERHLSVVIGHIKTGLLRPVPRPAFRIAICFDLVRCWKKKGVLSHGDHGDQLVRRSLKLSFLPVSTSQLTDCPSHVKNSCDLTGTSFQTALISHFSELTMRPVFIAAKTAQRLEEA
jgi:hypothetical protein